MVDAEAISYLDDLLEEYLLFRGFTGSLRQFQAERKNDKLKGFQVAKLVAQLFSLVHSQRLTELLELWSYLGTSFFSRLEDDLAATVQKLDLSLKRYYVVYALQCGQQDKALEFFKVLASDLSNNRHWKTWFVLPYVKSPELDPQFRVFFSKSWAETFTLSLHNFLSTIFRSVPLPRVLNFNIERQIRKSLENQLLALKQENDTLRGNLHNIKHDLEKAKLQSGWITVTPQSMDNVRRAPDPSASPEPNRTRTPSAVQTSPPSSSHSSPSTTSLHQHQLSGGGGSSIGPSVGVGVAGSGGVSSTGGSSIGTTTTTTAIAATPGTGAPSTQTAPPAGASKEPPKITPADRIRSFFSMDSKKKEKPKDEPPTIVVPSGPSRIASILEEPPRPITSVGAAPNATAVPIAATTDEFGEPKSLQQAPVKPPTPLRVSRSEAYGANSAITACKFSPGGTYMACGTQAGVVRIWPLTMTNQRNSATIYGSSEILSLEWEPKSGRLLFCGTGDAKIKVWNVGGEKVIGDLSLNPSFSKVRKIVCNPAEQSFACAAAPPNDLKGGALFTWNTKTLQLINKIDVGSTVNSFAYNHNGSMIVAGCADGSIRVLDMKSLTPIMSWKGHSDQVQNVTFSYDETSIFSMGADNKLLRWSMNNAGKVIRQYQYDGMPEKTVSADIAFDVDGNYFIVGSKYPYGYIYHVDNNNPLMKVGRHTYAVTSVDWHPIDLCVLTGSQDTNLCLTGMGFDLSQES